MSTKILLRFLVTIVILAATVLGVWIIWFKPTNELEVFNMLTELQNDKQAVHKKALDYEATNDEEHDGIKQNYYVNAGITDSGEGMVDIFSFDDKNGTESQDAYYGAIAYLRGYMFGFGQKNLDVDGQARIIHAEGEIFDNAQVDETIAFSNANLERMYNSVDQAFKYYYSYVQLASGAENKEVKEIKNTIKALNASYDGFVSSVDQVYAIRDQYEASNATTVLSETASLYTNIANDYYGIVKNYTKLTLQLKDFVVKNVFDGNEAFDAKTVYYNVVLNSISALNTENGKLATISGSTIQTDANYVNATADIACVINAGEANVNAAIIEAYANLTKNYAEGLTGTNGIYNIKRDAKVKVVGNDATATSVYNETYLPNIKLLLDLFYV